MAIKILPHLIKDKKELHPVIKLHKGEHILCCDGFEWLFNIDWFVISSSEIFFDISYQDCLKY